MSEVKFKPNDALIVSWDFSHNGDAHVLIVGKRVPIQPIGYRTEIINAFQGADAHAVYDMLTKKKEKPNEN